MNAMELFFLINEPNIFLYYDVIDNEFAYNSINPIEYKKLKEYPKKYKYEEINHKDIFRFFVKNAIDDKIIRKELFNILRKRIYFSEFINKLKELNLYDLLYDYVGTIYEGMLKEWLKNNNITKFN